MREQTPMTPDRLLVGSAYGSAYEMVAERAENEFGEFFGEELTKLIDLWESERPALVEGRQVERLRDRLEEEMEEMWESPDDPAERADVMIFANRLATSPLVVPQEWREEARRLGGECFEWMVDRGLVPSEVVGRKVMQNCANYPEALMQSSQITKRNPASRLLLRHMRSQYPQGHLPDSFTPVVAEEALSFNGTVAVLAAPVAGGNQEQEEAVAAATNGKTKKKCVPWGATIATQSCGR